MFGSPCSLRSAQCATLIALAAAAGISRFEPSVPEPVAPAQAESPAVVTSRASDLRHYFVSVYVAAQHLGLKPVTAHATMDHSPATAPATVAVVPASPPLLRLRVRFARTDHVRPDPRTHAYPYAVGPPNGEASLSDRATCTEVHGDSRVALAVSNRPLFYLRTARLIGAAVDPESGGTPSSELSPARLTGGVPLLVRLCFPGAPVGASPKLDARREIIPV